MVVHRRNIDLHVRMVLLNAGDALRRSQHVHQLDVLAAIFLHKADGGGGGTAGGQHGVDDDHIPLRDIGGHLAVVFHRLQRIRITEQADMAHPRGGDHFQNSVHHAKACPQNGNDGQLFASNGLEDAGSHGSFNLHVLQRQVAGGFISHQHSNFRDKLPEVLGAGVLAAQNGQLVLKQGMAQDVDVVVHVPFSFFFRSCKRSACAGRR